MGFPGGADPIGIGLEPGLAYLFGFYGMAKTASSVSSIIIGLEPIFIVMVNYLLFRQKMSVIKLALISTCFVGISITLVSSSFSLDSFSITGSLLVAIGTFIAAVFVSISGRTVLLFPPTIILLFSQISFLVLLVSADAQFLGGTIFSAPSAISQPDFFKIIFAGSLQFGVSFWLFLCGLF